MAHENKDYGKSLVYDPDFNGPLKRRSCTDIICFGLIFVFLAIWIGIGVYAFTKGDMNSLLIPKDSQKSRCGVDSHVKDKPYLFFFDLTKCLKPLPFTGCDTPQVCVKECPNDLFLLSRENFKPDDIICIDGVEKPWTYEAAKNLVAEKKCAEWYLPSKSVLKRCLYNVADRRLLMESDASKVKDDEVTLMKRRLNSAASWLALIVQNTITIFSNTERNQQVGNNVVSDVGRSWWKIGTCLVFAMLLCIIYIVVMRWIAGVMVWLSIFAAIGLLVFCTYYSITKYLYLRDHPISLVEQEDLNVFEQYLAKEGTWLVIAIILIVVLIIILLTLLFLRSRIVLAIALISEASKAVSAITAALFFPILPWLLQVGVIGYAIFVGLYLSTIGDSSFVVKGLSIDKCLCKGEAAGYKNDLTCDPDIFRTNCYEVNNPGKMCISASCHFLGIESPNLVKFLHVFNVFGFFWLLFFVSAFGEMVLAGTFAVWYWTFRKSDVPFFAVTQSTCRTLRYHIGTLAFGSLIIAICRMIRVILEYIDHKLKKYNNPVATAILCCCKCCFWCLEKFLQFINRNAYIMCAIHGKNFCVSAKDAFNLLMRNIIRVVVLDKVTDFLLFLSKIMITTAVVCVAYAVFVLDVIHVSNEQQLNYNFVPVIIVGIGAFFIATVFFSVFTMAVDTLFLCFLEDSERNDGTPEKPYYMSKELRKILGKKNK